MRARILPASFGLALALSVGPALADVLVGVAAPLSGSFGDVGHAIDNGVRLAAEAINARGGLDGQSIKVVTVDDKCDAETGAAVANQLVGKDVVLVIGHACTSAALAASKVYADHGVLFLSPAATNPRLTDEGIGPTVLRLAVRSDRQAAAIASYLASRFAGKRVAFAHDGSVYGQGLTEAASKLFADQGGAVAMVESFTPGEKSQNNLVGKIQDAAVSAVVLGALQSDGAVIASEMRARGLPAAVVGNEALGLVDYAVLAGAAAEGTVFMLPDYAPKGSAAVDLGIAAEEAHLQLSDALVAAHAALEAGAAALAEGRNGVAGAAYLREKGADTVLGHVTFDAKGDWVEGRYWPQVWHDGQYGPLP